MDHPKGKTAISNCKEAADLPRPLLIVVEGLDGVGKSTVAKLLAKKLNVRLLSTPPEEWGEFRKTAEMIYAENGAAKQLFYLAAACQISLAAAELHGQGKTVIIDRYWPSTFAYDILRRGALDFHSLRPLVENLIRPDYTVFLTASRKERRNRMEKRDKADGKTDRASLKKSKCLLKRYNQLLSDASLMGKVLRVSTSRHSTDKSVAEILSRLSLADNV